MPDKKPKKTSEKFWPELWRLLAPAHKLAKVIFALSVLDLALAMVGPYILKLVIDRLAGIGESGWQAPVLLLAAYLAAEQSVSFVQFWRDRRLFRLFFEVEADLSARAQDKLVSLPLAYHESENTGSKISKIERGIQKILDLITNLSWEVIPTLMQLIFTVAVMLAVDWRLGASILVFAPAFIFSTYRTNKSLFRTRKERFKEYEAASGKMGEAIININTVKSFVQEEREASEHRAMREHIRDRGIKEWYWLLKSWLSRNALVDLGRTSILAIAVYLAAEGGLSLGTLVFAVALSEKAYFSLYRLSRFYDRMEEGAVAVGRFTAMLKKRSENDRPLPRLAKSQVAGRVQFIDVSFAYSSAGKNALERVSLDIPAGATTALVGPSGGGKTTIARMIYRHYDPGSGRILLDGRDLSQFDLRSLRQNIAIVPQEVEIFNTSVKDNISYGCPSAGQDEIAAAARIANAEEFILGLPARYGTEVGERGVKLSGGQRQRIGIARAILADPRILIFDEATSNLDSYSEKLIQEAMEKVSRNRTVIVIAHRLSTIRKADRIYVLENGRLAEQGTHYELAKRRGGLYAKLLSLQEMGDVG